MSVPTRQIIVLSKVGSVISYVLRADVPVGQETAYANPGAVSPVGNAADPDLPAIRAGQIVQSVRSQDIPKILAESGAQYKARIQQILQDNQTAYQSVVTGADPQAFYGAFYNGSVWATSGA